MNDSVEQLVSVIKSRPGVDNVVAFTGGQGNTNGGFIFMSLKPLDERKASATQILDRLRPKMTALPVASAFLQPAQDLRIGGRQSNALYQYTIQSDTSTDLAHWGPILLREMKALPGFQDVNTDQQNGGLDQYLTYDRTTAARLGITPQGLDSTLYSAFGQSGSLHHLHPAQPVLRGAGGRAAVLADPRRTEVYLPELGERRQRSAQRRRHREPHQHHPPLRQSHQLFPSVTVSFNLAPGMSLSDATREVAQMQERLNMPQTVRGFFAGTAQAYQTSLGQRADPGRHCAARGLHRARNSL